ncbi:MAG TPA: hypothetical protein VN947_02690 [Polyangia bacterium]|nr:hypothetical protein [Polyangia bacterium]
MANASEWARRFEEWTTSLPADVTQTFEMLTNDSVAPPGRRWLAAALSYTLTQLDLIPDHERAGSIDDAFVLRVAYGLAAEHAAKTSTKDAAIIARMTQQEDELRDFLGDALYAKLRRYVSDLADKEVRGRTVDHILADERARGDMKRELDIQVKKMKAAHAGTADEGEALTVSVKSYLKMKLGAP